MRVGSPRTPETQWIECADHQPPPGNQYTSSLAQAAAGIRRCLKCVMQYHGIQAAVGQRQRFQRAIQRRQVLRGQASHFGCEQAMPDHAPAHGLRDSLVASYPEQSVAVKTPGRIAQVIALFGDEPRALRFTQPLGQPL